MIEKGSSRGTAASYQRAANPAGSVPDSFSPAACASPIGPPLLAAVHARFC